MQGRVARVDFLEEKPMPHPVMLNKKGLYKDVKGVVEALLGEEKVHILPLTIGVENFNLLSQRTYAVVLRLG